MWTDNGVDEGADIETEENQKVDKQSFENRIKDGQCNIGKKTQN